MRRVFSVAIQDILRTYWLTSSNQEEKIKGLIPLLFEEGLDIEPISKLTDVSVYDVRLYMEYLLLFSIKEYFSLSKEGIEKEVNEEYMYREKLKKQETQEREKRTRKEIIPSLKNIGNFVLSVLLSILIFLFQIIVSIISIPKVLIGTIFRVNGQKKYSVTKNEIFYEKNANNNVSVQITGDVTIINDKKEKEPKIIIEGSSKSELAKKFVEQIINGEKRFNFESSVVSTLYDSALTAKGSPYFNKSMKKHILFLIALAIIIYLSLSITAKSGFIMIGIFGLIVLINYDSCLGEKELVSTFETKKVEPILRDSTVNETIDTLSKLVNEAVIIADTPDKYKVEVEKIFQRDKLCSPLAIIGKKQKHFFDNIDKINHKLQPYYISDIDGKMYLHVVTYDKIKQAAYQVYFINSKKGFKARILSKTSNDFKEFFTVVIGKFDGIEISDLCSHVDEWEKQCFGEKLEVGCIFNN